MLIIHLIMVLFSDYLQESRTQQDELPPEPVPHKKKEKPKEKKDQTYACPKVRKKSLTSFDRTGMWYH